MVYEGPQAGGLIDGFFIRNYILVPIVILLLIYLILRIIINLITLQ